MREEYTVKVKETVENEGYRLLNKNVDNRKERLFLICPNGHEFSTSLNNFASNKRRCSKCKKKIRGLELFNEYKIYLYNFDYILSSPPRPIIKRDKCLVICKNEHEWNVSFTDFELGTRCPKCNPYYREKLTQEEVVKRYKEKDYKLISKYDASHIKVTAECPVGHLWYHYPNNFQKGERCHECFGSKKYSTEEVLLIFIAKGFIPTFQQYYHNKQQLTFICPKHKEFGEQDCSLHNLNRGLANCQVCYRDKFRGENSSNWTGGYSEIPRAVRGYIYHKWTFPSLEKDGFKCFLSSVKDNLEVHHVHDSFHNLLEDAMTELDVRDAKQLRDLTIAQTDNLKNTVLLKHEKSGLGVTLTKPIHNLFHSIYGVRNNNLQQFEEFCSRYKTGEFSKILKTKGVLI